MGMVLLMGLVAALLGVWGVYAGVTHFLPLRLASLGWGLLILISVPPIVIFLNLYRDLTKTGRR